MFAASNEPGGTSYASRHKNKKSRAETGSSQIINSGCVASARAIPIRT